MGQVVPVPAAQWLVGSHWVWLSFSDRPFLSDATDHGLVGPPFPLVLTTIHVQESPLFLACGWHYPLPARSRIDVEPQCFVQVISRRIQKREGHSGHDVLQILLGCFTEPTSTAEETSRSCPGARVTWCLVSSSLRWPRCPGL